MPDSVMPASQDALRTAQLPAPAAAADRPVLHSHELMQGRNAIVIEHNGSVYRLQTTRQGKLILTK
ncbi:MAG: hemin uptake protein HemP [Gammaproteobacteria bacterium]